MGGSRVLHVKLENALSRCLAGEGVSIAQAIVAIGAVEVMSGNKYDTELPHQPQFVDLRCVEPFCGPG